MGYLLHQVFAPASLRVAIGVLVLLLSAAMILLRPRPRPLGDGMLLLAGLASGVLGGAVGIAGPPVALLFLLTATDMEQSRATLGLGLFIVCLVAVCAFAVGGQLTIPVLVLAGLALPVVMLGDSLGNLLFLRHGRQGALRVSIVLTAVVGASSLGRGIAAMLP
ncbi:TSUP family transporter [Cupriavidus necator]